MSIVWDRAEGCDEIEEFDDVAFSAALPSFTFCFISDDIPRERERIYDGDVGCLGDFELLEDF